MNEGAGQSQHLSYRLMTYNIGGGRKERASEMSLVLQVIQNAVPDILVIQEATRWLDADGLWHSDLDEISPLLGENARHVFTPILTMNEHLHPENKTMVDILFDDCRDWQQGNAIISRWPFHRLGRPDKPGAPCSVLLSRSPVYEGSRDTEPRAALLARIGRAPQFPIVIGVHLSTLVGERGEDVLPGKPEQATRLREVETRRLIGLLREHVLDAHEIVFLLGDFNAVLDEPALQCIIDEGGFIAATPAQGTASTHLKVKEAIDHIFIFPPERIVQFESTIVDTDKARLASDHLPVITDVIIG
ncbi:MAG: endonuclease/exonuclease/phosphatase family protein [Anaerolineae bacterium]|nr:endonuclease/exonuclease/phosphatase family protein [Anaerolineae bacterium]